jgi:hypothetical protein
MVRAEKVKELIEEQKTKGTYHEQIVIENDSTGHSYKNIFGRFLDEEVTSVDVEDPHIRTFHQVGSYLGKRPIYLQFSSSLEIGCCIQFYRKLFNHKVIFYCHSLL